MHPSFNRKTGQERRADESLSDYELEDRYKKEKGRVFLTGTQALIAIMLRQKRLDQKNRMHTAGFISGYRGSPLGGLDKEIWSARNLLEPNAISFLPAINEDLAATAVLGTQQLEIEPDKEVDGVFSMWYGKGPGVDRAGDALKHGNAFGSSPNGGTLVVAGDDHGCVSSSMSHQSDVALMSAYIPTLHPANVEEYLEYGAYGFAMSRYSGMWIGFKAVSEVVESAASVDIPPDPEFVAPTDYIAPADSLSYRWPDLPGMQIERRMIEKKNAVLSFARANPIDRVIFDVVNARYGIITTGKAHQDLMEALLLLGITQERAKEIGLDVYKVGMVWPLELVGVEKFLEGKEEILVVEEKRGIIESELKEHLYDRDISKPKFILGKYDEHEEKLISWVEELSPSTLAPIVAKRLRTVFADLDFTEHLNRVASQQAADQGEPKSAKRVPYFCSGCPHNTSTRVPEGSRALAGIGCHFMASWMGRETSDLIQMGGEGVNWATKSRYLKKRHAFQNLGDGTYFHSGSMAIRQAIAAEANITYKILYNDAVAMTGGQPVDGTMSVGQMASQLVAEGTKKVVVVSDQPGKIKELGGYPKSVRVYHRDELDSVQRELREIEGVTALIYEQTCASEKRRKRKRNQHPDPPKRIFINDLVCEGCGDCSRQSNCLSIVPKNTEFGRKRQIDQSSCNKDYSCVKGFCPSFVTIEGGQVRRPKPAQANAELQHIIDNLKSPCTPQIDQTYNLLVAGVGGTGVVTIGAIITMAAHLESKGASVLDFTGFAQKGGTVLSYVRLANSPGQINQVRIDKGSAHTAIICDLVVGTDERAIRTMHPENTQVIANTHILPTADFIRDRNVDFQTNARVAHLEDAVGSENLANFDANAIAHFYLGDTVFSNMLLLGYAWQLGAVPLSLQAIYRAIELNGIAPDKNRLAFNIGRAASEDIETVKHPMNRTEENKQEPNKIDTLDQLIEARADFLKNYQNKAYAEKYSNFVRQIIEASSSISRGNELGVSVARHMFKLMAYKDEYEVARLHSSATFKQQIENNFEGKYRLKYHLAPPLLSRRKDPDGRPRKITFGPWIGSVFQLLQYFKFLRGTVFDIFGKTEERKLERQLVLEYESDLLSMLPMLDANNISTAIEIATLPDDIRGYGPVKLESIRKTQSKKSALLKAFFDRSAVSNDVIMFEPVA